MRGCMAALFVGSAGWCSFLGSPGGPSVIYFLLGEVIGQLNRRFVYMQKTFDIA
jgi:hypothetical protein